MATMAERPQPDEQEDSLEFDPLDPHASTRVAPRGTAMTKVVGGAPESAGRRRTSETAVVETIRRDAETMVVAAEPRPAPKPPPPLKIDFSEVLGKSKEAAGAKRIGAQALEMGDFQSKYDKQALERATATPKFEMATFDDEGRNKPIRVVERRGRFWLRALLFVVVPAVLAVGAAAIYLKVHNSGNDVELEKLHNADQAHRKAAADHEKEMAR